MKRQTRLLTIATIALLSIGSGATMVIAQTALPTDVFEVDDGNIVPNGTTPNQDWQNVNCPSDTPSSNFLNATGVVADRACSGNGAIACTANSDCPTGQTCLSVEASSIFTGGGSKDVYDINFQTGDTAAAGPWLYTNGSVPDKDDIENAYAARYTASDGSVILVVGGDRFDNSGSAFIGAWFFQNPVNLGPIVKSNGTGSFVGTHKNGDVLILANFTTGGSVATIQVLEWVGSAGSCPGGPCPTPIKGTPLADITNAPTSKGSTNSLVINLTSTDSCSDTWKYTPKTGTSEQIPLFDFFEVGINLSALGLTNECFASFLLETRSSARVDAQLKDFVLHTFAPCAFGCDKQVTSPVCAGATDTYVYTFNNPGGVDLNAFGTDDAGTPANTADDFNVCVTTNGGTCQTTTGSCSFVLPAGQTKTCTLPANTSTAGSKTNTLTVHARPGTGGELTPQTCSATLVVNPVPAVTIPSLACAFTSQTQFTLTANVTGGTSPFAFLWSPGNQTTSSITQTQGGSFSVGVTDANGCTASASRSVGYCSN